MDATPLLKIDQLETVFRTEGRVVRAVDKVSFSIEAGQTVGLVGESGSGKSVTSLSIMGLLPDIVAKIEGGSIAFVGRDLTKLSQPELRNLRGSDISMIFQEPMTSLNPVFTVGFQVMEAIRLHQDVGKEEARRRTIALFDEVGIPDPESRIDSYPHEMSGGQKQRVMIAMALSCNPELLIADEPTTALDVTIQKQILDLLRRLRDERGMAILFITHDLGVIAEIADYVAVMYRGKLVEFGLVEQMFRAPKHPYTRGLVACRPALDTTYRRLPTVSDFMATERDESGQIQIRELELSDERIEELRASGRGRYLHKRADCESLGYDLKKLAAGHETTFVTGDEAPLLAVENLKVHFPVKSGLLRRTTGHIRAVDGVSFDVYRGQTLGLVGESGCGKTTCGRSILRLVEPTEGVVRFDGEDVRGLDSRRMRALRRRMQIIFQDPYSSLNPRMTIQSILTEPLRIHNIGEAGADRRSRVAKLLAEVDMPAEAMNRYPHEFSGGQRQRIGIARALAVEPELIICDESVSALDVSVQATVLNLLKDLQERRNLTYIFISHDLSVVKFMADMMAVMKDGRFVEFGPSDAIYEQPAESYTRRLIEAIPVGIRA